MTWHDPELWLVIIVNLSYYVGIPLLRQWWQARQDRQAQRQRETWNRETWNRETWNREAWQRQDEAAIQAEIRAIMAEDRKTADRIYVIRKTTAPTT